VIAVSQQAIFRLRVFPAALFLAVLQALLPTLAERWQVCGSGS